jgi:uncharacterized membrane protein YraQ (UPF0718 family)
MHQLFRPAEPMADMFERELLAFWLYFKVLFRQIAPYFALGIFLGSAISVFGKGKIAAACEALGSRKLGAFGVIPASLLGIASPLCMYGTIPIAASFSQKGMKDDWLAAFIMSSILLNPQLIIYSMALGTKALVIRCVSCFVCGAAAGLCVRYFFKDSHFFNFNDFSGPENHDTDPNIFMRLLKNLGRNVKATGLYFLLGLALAVLFQLYVPQDAFARLFGRQWKFGVFLAATIGVPLYACGGGTIPLLLGWLEDGMSMGAAAAFMLTGPATKITNLGALKIVLGMKNFLFYLLFTMLFAAATGLITDFLLY